VVLASLALSAAVAIPGTDSAPAAGGTPLRVLSGWAPYWNPDSGPAGVRAMGSLASSVSPFAYSVTGATSIGLLAKLDRSGQLRTAARALRLPLIPTLIDESGKGTMAAILADPAQRQAHVDRLVQLAVDGNFDGLDLDYEVFAFSDGSATWATTKPLWTQFIVELSTALRARAKMLFVTVPPTYNNSEMRGSGYWVYNLPGIAPYVDRIRIMAYNYSTSTVGPNSPLSWTQKIVDYVAANLPPSKVELGIPLYGRDWITGSTGTCPVGTKVSGKSTIRTSRAIELAKSKNATVERLANGEMRFRYTVPVYAPTSSTTTTAATSSTTTTTEPEITDPAVTDPAATDPATSATSSSVPSTTPTNPPLCTVSHTVYYPDAGSSLQKLQQALDAGLAGVTFFAVGYEEARHYSSLRGPALRVRRAPGTNPIGAWRITSPSGGVVRVSGWALDPETSLPIVVRITVNGRTVSRVLANGERTDIAARYPGNGPFHGASVDLPLSRGRHRICVQALGIGAGRSVRTLACRTLRIAAPPATTTTTTVVI